MLNVEVVKLNVTLVIKVMLLFVLDLISVVVQPETKVIIVLVKMASMIQVYKIVLLVNSLANIVLTKQLVFHVMII